MAIAPTQSFLDIKSEYLGISYFFFYAFKPILPSLDILVVLFTEVPGLIII